MSTRRVSFVLLMVVVVSLLSSTQRSERFLWSQTSGMQIVPGLNQFVSVAGLSNQDQIVGSWIPGSHSSGFIWTKLRGSQNLNSPILPGQQRTIGATVINEKGQIAADGISRHALLLTPTKQSSSQRSEP